MRAAAGLIGLVLLAACATTPGGPAAVVPASPSIRVEARPVPMDASDLQRRSLGAFVFAGGVDLTSPDTSRLHGLSDLKVWPDGRLLAVSDEGDMLEAQLVLDAAGRLGGIDHARLTPLIAEDGRPLLARGKGEADSEGIAELADGVRLVSLERDDRVLAYPAGGGPPRRAPAPDVVFPKNLGMEALAADPAAGPDAYIVGAEQSGRTWTCRLSGGCAPGVTVQLAEDQGLTAVAPLPGGRRAYLLRAFSPLKGVRVTLRIAEADGTVVDELRLLQPLTVDNFEGLAAVPRPDLGVRFYLVADDNFSRLQRTLLLAFDWREPKRR